jgi:rare lipoprotein A
VRKLGLIGLSVVLSGATAFAAETTRKRDYSGIASVYSRSYAGSKTASGEINRSGALTAAHRTLPFGTRVRVTNRRNGRTVTVRINDRGPFIRNRVIDLSPAAARSLGFSGLASVEVAVER